MENGVNIRVSQHICTCMYEMEESARKGITACTGMKWKRVSVRVSQYVWV